MEADLSHPPERLPALIAPLLDGSCDIAIGSRYVPAAVLKEGPCRADGSHVSPTGLPAPFAT